MNPMSIMAQAEKLGIPELQRSIQNGVVPAFIGVPLLQEKVKKAKQMQMGMAAQQPKRPSVAEQVGQEAQQATIADIMKAQALRMQGEMGQTGGISDSLPKPEGYAKGGPIAFAEGTYGEDIRTQLQRLLAEQEAAQYGEFGSTGWTPEEIAKYTESGWTPEDIARYKSPGAIATKASIPSGPTINVPPGGFNAQTNYPAVIKPQELAPIYQQKTGLPATIPQGASASATPTPMYKSGLPANPWDVASEGISLDKFKSAAKFIGSKALRGLGGIGAVYDIAETASEPSNIDKHLALRAAKGDKQAQAVLDRGGINPILSRTKASVRELLATPEQAYDYVKSKLSSSEPDAYVGASERVAPKPVPATENILNKNALNRQTPDADQAQAMQDRIVTRKAPPVMGGNAPAPTQTPYAQAAVPTTQTQPAQEEDKDQSLADYMKQYRDVTGENKGIDALRGRLSEREARLAKEEDRAPWMALMQAGLSTMAGTSPNALSNIGQGGAAGLQAYTRSMNKLEDAKDKSFDIQAKLEEAQRGEELAAAKYGLDSVQVDKKAKATAKLEREKMAHDFEIHKLDKAAQIQIANIQAGATRYSADARADMYGDKIKDKGNITQYQYGQLVDKASDNVDKMIKDQMLSFTMSPEELSVYRQRMIDAQIQNMVGGMRGGMMPTQPAAANTGKLPGYTLLSSQ